MLVRTRQTLALRKRSV